MNHALRSIIATGALLACGQAVASGGGAWDPFVNRSAPDSALGRYQSGELGLVLGSYDRLYLYTAWRSVMLGPEELKAAPNPQGGLLRAGDRQSQWRLDRRRAGRESLWRLGGRHRRSAEAAAHAGQAGRPPGQRLLQLSDRQLHLRHRHAQRPGKTRRRDAGAPGRVDRHTAAGIRILRRRSRRAAQPLRRQTPHSGAGRTTGRRSPVLAPDAAIPVGVGRLL